MIKVENLTKYYGKNIAIENVGFSLDEGEILGFLGPNGAGKSTTMNIIAGYISSDTGSVKIGGVDILDDPSAAKKKIGYLEFMFDLKKVRMPKDEHINKVCAMSKIENVKERIIKHLSKGYRQRVGLAQALLGDPPVLILDEPTAGLDPAQIIEMRKLISMLGKKHTVILSSHVLSEVQSVCDKIIVINNGKIVADDFTSKFTKSGRDTQRIRLVVEGREKNTYGILKNIDGVSEVIKKGETEKGCFEFTVESGADVRRAVYRALSKSDCTILVMSPIELSLEETFLNIISGKYNENGGGF